MKEQEHIEKAHTLAQEWFQYHHADYYLYTESKTNSTITVINWRRPGTGNYAMQFMMTNNCVIVVGDVGDAIYGFGCNLTLEWLAKIDWHYFTNKCVASETGRDYSMKVQGISHKVPNVRAIGHFVGLQMAIKQIMLPKNML